MNPADLHQTIGAALNAITTENRAHTRWANRAALAIIYACILGAYLIVSINDDQTATREHISQARQ